MSNVVSAGIVASIRAADIETAIYLAWTALALILAWRFGLFRRGSVRGPARLAEGETALPLLMVLLLGFSAWFIAGQGYALSRLGPRPATAPATNAAQAPSLSSPDLIRASALVSVAGIVALLAGGRALRPGGLTRLGFSPGKLGGGVVCGALAMVIVLPLLLWANLGTEAFWRLIHYRHPHEHELLRAVRQVAMSRGLVALMVVSVTVLAPVYEELFFRGHLQTALREAIGPWPSIIAAALLFSLMHAGWTTPVIFLLAVCLGYVYERTGNLWASIVMHAIFNGYQTAFFLAGQP